MPNRLMLAAMILAMSTSVAFAQPMMQKPMPGMLHHVHNKIPMWRKHNTIPMLLPLAEMASYRLHLSNQQVSSLAIWRNEHMGKGMPVMQALKHNKMLLRHALLMGQGQHSIRPLVHHINKERHTLLNLKIAQARFVRTVLSNKQWSQLVRMYRRMNMRFGMMR